MSKFTSLIARAPKRFSAVVAMVAAAIIIPTAVLAWGPDRPTFTLDHPAGYVTFNSITDNPVQGDERNFVQVKEADAANSTYSDSATLTPGKTYTMFVYYHNDAASNLNASGVGIAHGAYVKAQLPAVVAKGATATKAVGYIGATNANPTQVWDDVSFSNASAGDVALRYVPGSAKIYNKGASNGSTVNDSIVTSGAPIGYYALDGNVPGCNDYSGYVTFNFVADQSNFDIQKTVRVHGTTDWKESVTAPAGSTVDYQLVYKNTGTTKQNDVVLKDSLPTGTTYVAGSTYLTNKTYPTPHQLSDNLTTSTGINIGNYSPGSVATVVFSAKVAASAEVACRTNTLHNVASAVTNNGTKQDSADVVVTSNKDCTPGTINVCQLSTKTIVNIKESDFDASKYSKDLSVCTPTVTPPELPHTGMTENIVAVIGLGAIVASVAYYIASRRALMNQ
jgi:uncharacterized repeat protein (TIGR01451 family)